MLFFKLSCRLLILSLEASKRGSRLQDSDIPPLQREMQKAAYPG